VGKYIDYTKRLLEHKYYVYKAGKIVGNIPTLRLIFHDWTKFLPVEFFPYAVYPFGDREKQTGKVQYDFDKAWGHHQKNNPHHWQYWILINDEDGTYCLDMPKTYIYEMVADWMGASKAYTGSWDMTDWLKKNIYKIQLSPNTRLQLNDILAEQGYSIWEIYGGKDVN